MLQATIPFDGIAAGAGKQTKTSSGSEKRLVYQSVWHPPNGKASWTPYTMQELNSDESISAAYQQYAEDLKAWEKSQRH